MLGCFTLCGHFSCGLQDQIEQEVNGVLDMLQHCYGIFNFKFELQLSTRPKKYLGQIEMWDRAEKVVGVFLYLGNGLNQSM